MLRHNRGRIYSMPFVRHQGAYDMLLTHDNLCKPTPVKQVFVAAIVILSNMYFFNVFGYRFRQVLIKRAGHFCFVGALLFCDKLQTHLGALLSGRALVIGTLQYIEYYRNKLELWETLDWYLNQSLKE